MTNPEKTERIERLLDMMAYAQVGLEKAKRGAKNKIKKQTGGDPITQQNLLLLMNKPNLPTFNVPKKFN